MYLERNVDKDLETWKNSSDRKPLIFRGARQVGKSSAVKNLTAKYGKLFARFAKLFL